MLVFFDGWVRVKYLIFIFVWIFLGVWIFELDLQSVCIVFKDLRLLVIFGLFEMSMDLEYQRVVLSFNNKRGLGWISIYIQISSFQDFLKCRQGVFQGRQVGRVFECQGVQSLRVSGDFDFTEQISVFCFIVFVCLVLCVVLQVLNMGVSQGLWVVYFVEVVVGFCNFSVRFVFF